MTNSLTPPGWYDFDDLPTRLQMEAKLARPRWDAGDYTRFQFRVMADGHISRKPGDHQLTQAQRDLMDAELASTFRPANAKKGDIHHLKTASFGLNREPV